MVGINEVHKNLGERGEILNSSPIKKIEHFIKSGQIHTIWHKTSRVWGVGRNAVTWFQNQKNPDQTCCNPNLTWSPGKELNKKIEELRIQRCKNPYQNPIAKNLFQATLEEILSQDPSPEREINSRTESSMSNVSSISGFGTISTSGYASPTNVSSQRLVENFVNFLGIEPQNEITFAQFSCKMAPSKLGFKKTQCYLK